MRVFADTADFAFMTLVADHVAGFTTNPTLMRQAGVTEYERWARGVVDCFPDYEISFEVVGDDLATIGDQARRIARWGPNVYVKVPVQTTDGRYTWSLVNDLMGEGVHVNVTAVFTPGQLDGVLLAMRSATTGFVSVFAGRIADTGVDPVPIVRYAVEHAPRNVEVIWASAREVWNIRHAEQAGAQIITLSPELLAKRKMLGRDLALCSLDTVRQFAGDAEAAGLSL